MDTLPVETDGTTLSSLLVSGNSSVKPLPSRVVERTGDTEAQRGEDKSLISLAVDLGLEPRAASSWPSGLSAGGRASLNAQKFILPC